MKKSLFVLLALVMVSGSCFAMDILTTANTVGQDKMTIEPIYSTTSFNIGGGGKTYAASLAGIGVRGYYGLQKDLDLFADYWSGSFVCSDLEFSEAATNMGIGAKYAFLKTSAGDPIDVAGIVELNSLSSKNYTWGTNVLGVTVSKLVKPNLTVFGNAAVLMNNAKVKGAKGVSETSTEFGIGCKYEVNTKFAVLGEVSRFTFDSDTYQTITVGGEFKI